MSAERPCPRVSVLIATHNHANYIRAALDSVCAQTLPAERFEIIVVDDGSTDDTSVILGEFAGRVRVLSRERRGLVASCNEALALAAGEHIVRLDSDDFVAPTWLERLAGAIEREPRSRAAVSDRWEGDGDDWRRVDVSPGNLFTLQACGVLLPAERVRAVGGFRGLYWEEYDLFLRLGLPAGLVRVAEPLYWYRRHSCAMTHDRAARLRGWRELIAQWGAGALAAAGDSRELQEAMSDEEANRVAAEPK